MTNESPLMTLKETAYYLGFSTTWAYRMVETGKLPAFKLGGQWRIRKSKLDKFIERGLGVGGLIAPNYRSKLMDGCVTVRTRRRELNGS